MSKDVFRPGRKEIRRSIRMTSTVERGLAAERGLLRTLANSEEYKNDWASQVALYSEAEASDFYAYHSGVEIDPKKLPYTQQGTVAAFFHTSTSLMDRFLNSRRRIFSFIAGDFEHFTIDDATDASNGLLDEGYALTSSMNAFNGAPMVAPRTNIGLDLVKKREIEGFCAEVGSDKPEGLREIMRRNIPRWMWYPLSLPDNIPSERDEQLRALWSGYTSQDANLLIHPDQLAEGKAPIHMAFKAAEEMEAQGEEDLGYALEF